MFSSSFRVLLVLAASSAYALCGPVQAVFEVSSEVNGAVGKPRQLHGRFLQITDIHPDPHYVEGSKISKACHRSKPKKKKKQAGYYGTPYSDCDSPLRFTNYTLDFLEQKWASQIDFVIWTGDNARHDNDRKLPRTTFEIYDLNRAVAHKMKDVFSSKGIPVVPSLGNNDVWPHNILLPGPNAITSQFSSIWQEFIPFPYRQVFQRGAYYSVEVIPDHLAVVALNTMYFYDSNKAVNGCPYSEPNDPGNLQLDWLEVQLGLFRERGLQVWLTGHVPPSRGNYFPECYVRYVDLALRYQDTILGHLFGHMNADHFFFLEAGDLELELDEQDKRSADPEIDINTDTDDFLFNAIIDDFSTLPGLSKVKLGDFAVINVSPPVVPNPYLPTFRIFSYNISGVETMADLAAGKMEMKTKMKGGKRKPGHHRGKHGDKSIYCSEEPFRMSWKCHLSNDSWHSDPESPSRKNQLWTPTGYAQYYVPDLGKADKNKEPKFELEYSTYKADILSSEGERPIPAKLLPRSLRNGTITKSKFAPYEMVDLTVESWYKLALELGKSKNKKLGKRFKDYMYLRD
ncbi:endopolyphosphatase [Marasmius fiardii PR-910]|nr:endopolyphosphatase [Marasmius fiardii PR-910]